MATTTIYLVRHGTTEWIERGKVHGALDSPLSAFGEWEAQQAASALADSHITHIYSSPQGRALQTAGFIARNFPHVAVTPLDGLREMGFGKMEGRRDLYKKYSQNPLLFIFIGPMWFSMLRLTGEKSASFHQRVLDAWHSILSQNGRGNIAVVSHAIALNTILTSLSCGEEVKKKKRFDLGSCSISRVSIDERGQATLVAVNDTTHLKNKEQYGH